MREAGATFEERDGWLVPVFVPGEAEHLAAVGIADLSHLTKLEVRPAPDPAGAGVVTTTDSRRDAGARLSAERVEATPFASALAMRLVLDVTARSESSRLSGRRPRR